MDKIEKTARRLLESERRFWLMKTEPGECSFSDVAGAPGGKMPWFGIRNYQARNFMRDDMKVGDGVLFYHSSCPKPGIVGLAEIASAPYPDETQFEPDNEYYDTKSTREKPRWLVVDVKALVPCHLIGIAALREEPELSDMLILRKGNRLSITPVTKAEFEHISLKLMHE